MQRRYIVTAAILVIIVAGVWGWDQYQHGLPSIPVPADSRAVTGLPVIAVTAPNGVRIAAEVASTPKQQQRGLMFRDVVVQKTGMLFVYDEEKYQQIWMKNVRIPLDVVFLDADKRITHIVSNISAPDPNISDDKIPKTTGYGRYILELGGGESHRLGLAKGMKLNFK